jgi:uncharacterized membrane protein YkgB
MFLTTLSFLITTPGVWASSAGGFPALSGAPGQFLIKDLALLGISVWTLGQAWKPASERNDRWRCAPTAASCRRECVTGSTSFF